MEEQQTIQSTQDPIVQRYQTLPDEITDLIDYGVVRISVNDVQRTYALTDTQTKLLENEVLLVLLLFLSRTGFAERIRESLEIDGELAATIEEYIGSMIFALVDEILTAAEPQLLATPAQESAASTTESKTAGENIPEEIQVRTDTEVKADAPAHEAAPVAPPSGLAAIESLRTMQGDADRIHGYGAYRRKHPQDADAENPESKAGRHADLPRYEE